MAEHSELGVLLIHGQSRELVAYFVEFLGAIGVSASSAIDLPSRGRNQKEKIEHLIDTTRLIIALLTFDEGPFPRPNVVGELTTSLARRPNDTIVLQEERDGVLADPGSNLDGHFITIPFSKDALHLALPAILKELRDHQLVSAVLGNQSTFEAGEILNKFLDEMDDIWEHEFDEAWEEIVGTKHESRFAHALDDFFQAYQNVFSGLIRDQKRGAELEEIALHNTDLSWGLALRAWEIVADAKLEGASSLPNTRKNKVYQLIHSAGKLIAQAKIHQTDPKIRIKKFREAVATLDKVIGGEGQ